MQSMTPWRWLLSVLALALIAAIALIPLVTRAQTTRPIDPAQHESKRQEATKAMANGNWKDALTTFRALATDPQTKPTRVADDLANALGCLNHLGLIAEWDGLIEAAVEAQPRNWRLLQRAAQSFFDAQHHGSIIAGKFERGPHRGGTAKSVYAFERDRVRALQLLTQALAASKGDPDTNGVALLHHQMAEWLLNRHSGQEAWRLGYLTDLTALPDYEDANTFRGWHHESKGAPVDADGKPVFHTNPKSWDDAQTDGQRWRWCLMQTMELNPSMRAMVQYEFATFLHQQFDVQTMAHFGRGFGRDEGDSAGDDTRKDESNPFAVKTLRDDETIARLANGVKRFKLADEFNFVAIFKSLAGDAKGGYAISARETLAQIYENRQQYDKAAEQWRQLLAGPGSREQKENWQARLDQIIKPPKQKFTAKDCRKIKIFLG